MRLPVCWEPGSPILAIWQFTVTDALWRTVPMCIVIGAATLAVSFANGLFAPGDSDAHNTDEVRMRREYDPRHRALAIIVASVGGCAVRWRQRRGRPAAD
jgi:hypothetical protein